MAFALLPFVVAFFWFGQSMVGWQQALAVPGAGMAGRMESLSVLSAQQAEMFNGACLVSAMAQPGVVSASLAVTLPPGVNLPTGAVCMTTPVAGGGRNVYGFLPVQPGAAGRVLADTNSNLTWHKVVSVGSAYNLVTGQWIAVPNTIPAGTLLTWVQTSS